MDRKHLVKDPYADMPPAPFAAWDYVLLLIAFVFISIASVPQLAALLAHL
jgi:hypothetical protein